MDKSTNSQIYEMKVLVSPFEIEVMHNHRAISIGFKEKTLNKTLN